MKIIETNIVTQEQNHQITTLLKECFRHDGLSNEAFLSNELNFDQALSCFYLGYEVDYCRLDITNLSLTSCEHFMNRMETICDFIDNFGFQ